MSLLVTLTTDFEERDPFAASMKGVLYSRCPGVQITDLSHDIPRQNVLEGALFLAGAVPYFPKGTVHVVAVAPGKRALAISIDGQFVVCPDNGVITLLAKQHAVNEAREITNPELILSEAGRQKFFGRDVFAPAAAFLAGGGALADVGPRVEQVALLNVPEPKREGTRSISGIVIHVDRFGNVVTNIHRSSLEGAKVKNVEVGMVGVGPVVNSFSEVPAGNPLAIFGSADYLEVACNGGRADTRLKLTPGLVANVTLEG